MLGKQQPSSRAKLLLCKGPLGTGSSLGLQHPQTLLIKDLGFFTSRRLRECSGHLYHDETHSFLSLPLLFCPTPILPSVLWSQEPGYDVLRPLQNVGG